MLIIHLLSTYIEHKVHQLGDNNSAVHEIICPNQHEVLYNEDLSMSSMVQPKKIGCLWLLTKHSLLKLCGILGSAVDIGLSCKKPSKSNTHVFCTIGSVITSVELPEIIPEVVQSWIEMAFNETDSRLVIKVRLKQIPCILEEDVMS